METIKISDAEIDKLIENCIDNRLHMQQSHKLKEHIHNKKGTETILTQNQVASLRNSVKGGI